MSKTRDAANRRIYKPRDWGRPSKSLRLPEPWYGLDTERDHRSGEFVCGYAVGEKTQEFQTLRDLHSGTYWVWNLPYDIEGMIRDLGEVQGWCMREDGAGFNIGNAQCVYYHGKRFEWKEAGKRLIFLEESSFFGRKGLDSVAKNLVGAGKKRTVKSSSMSVRRFREDPEYNRLVREYCQEDARLAYIIVRKLEEGVQAAGASLGIETHLGGTPGATARKFLQSVGHFPPVVWETHRDFLRSYCGGRFEIVKRGVFYDVYQYDIVSAYVWALGQCPFLTSTTQRRFSRRISEEAQYGSYEVSFSTDEYLGLAPGWNKNTRVYSAAEDKVWLTLPEVQWLHNNGHPYQIHRGIELWDENSNDTWARVTADLFRLKAVSAKNSPSNLGAKAVMVSLYGVLIQLVPIGGQWVPIEQCKKPVDVVGELGLEEGSKDFEAGKYYAPIYSGHLTALTRLKLLDLGKSLGESYIGGHTDSVLTTKPITDLGKALGDWDLECKASRLIITKTGLYAMDQRVKARGVDRNIKPEALLARTQKRNMRKSVKQALDWSDVSVIRAKRVANNLPLEHKRIWDRPLSRKMLQRGEWTDSKPFRMVAK